MDTYSKNLALFKKSKSECLNKEDMSRKGSIDDKIREIVDIINCNQYYFTTSTCSGRISLIEKPVDDAGKKKGNNFLMNSHQPVELDEFVSVTNTFRKGGGTISESCLWLKFEPFILHIQCFNFMEAKKLLDIALASGCRNSGLSMGKKEKYLVAIRSTSALEVPICCESRFEYPKNDYLEFLLHESNRRLHLNFQRLDLFQSLLREGLKQTVRG